MPTYSGTSGDDVFAGGSDVDTAFGNGGNDSLSGEGHNDVLIGGDGADTLAGGSGDDWLFSYSRDPNFTGLLAKGISFDVFAEADILTGGDGDDYIFAGFGDSVDGGTHSTFGDRLYISFMGASSGVSADFRLLQSQGSIIVGGATIANIQTIGYLEGSDFDDFLVPIDFQYPTGANVYGRGGNDHIIGGYFSGWAGSGLYGGDGDDIIDGRDSGYGPTLYGEAGDDIIYTSSNPSVADGGDGDDTIYTHYETYGGDGDDLIIGEDSYYGGIMYGNAGDDEIRAASTGLYAAGGAGADILTGGTGSDYMFSGDIIAGTGNPEDDVGTEHDQLDGADGNDNLSAGYGDDVDGGTGTDTLRLTLAGAGAGVTFDTNAIVAGTPYAFGGGTIQNIESLTYLRATDFADTLTLAAQSPALIVDAGGGDDLINAAHGPVNVLGGDGNDRLVSGGSGNSFDGGGGIDTIDYRNAGNDVTVMLGLNPGQTGSGPGSAELKNIENVDGSSLFADLIFGSNGDNVLRGLGGNDRLIGRDGNDSLDGGAGADQMAGEAGDDISYVDDGGDSVIESLNQGNDIVYAGVTWTLNSGSHVETLVVADGSGPMVLTGNELANILLGNAGNNLLVGGGGDDVIDGGAGQDVMNGGLGNDLFRVDDAGDQAIEAANEGTDEVRTALAVYSLAGLANIENLTGTGNVDQQLTGNAGANVIDGGLGADLMAGGLGDDVYYVDNEGDVVDEAAGAGSDRVATAISYALAAGAEIERLEATVQNSTSPMDLAGNEFGNTIIGNDGVNVLSGGGGNDQLFSLAGNDILQGGAGSDFMSGGDGNDVYHVDDAGDVASEDVGRGSDRVAASVSYALTSGSEIELLEAADAAGTGALDFTGNGFANTLGGNQGVNFLRGEGGNDILLGYGGDDYLIGGTGLDTMTGGLGNDVYYVDNGGDVVNETAGGGNDRIATSVSYALAATAEVETLEAVNSADAGALDLTGNGFVNLLIGQAGVNFLRGEGGNDQLIAYGGNDFLIGGTGADLMYGGTGNDTFYVDNIGDRAYENAGEGTDRIATSISYALDDGSEVERLESTNTTDTNAMDLTGSSSANTIIGNAGVNFLRGEGGNDQLIGLAGNDFLIGGAGADLMYGGLGDDTYYVDDTGDLVNESAGQGSDRVAAASSYALLAGAEIERLEAITQNATNAMDLTGSNTANTILGNDGVNILRGEGGNDALFGFAGDDLLVGGAGADVMAGGLGDDTYYVDHALDVVGEAAGQGNDRVAAASSYALAADAEVEWLEAVTQSATNAMDLTGSNSANAILGNDGANVLRGEGGNDTLSGFGGDDVLVGGAGADVMAGGLGNDIYYVDNALDQVSEAAGQGNDRVAASASFALAAGAEIELIETVTQSATGAIDLGGSDSANTIRGNEGANVLRGEGGNDNLSGYGGDDFLVGGAGVDTMAGSTGNDTYYVDDANDVVVELGGEGGADRIAASVSYTLAANAEIETLEAANGADTNAIALTGNGIANVITGNAGANLIDGKGGSDLLTGRGGADTFAFTTTLGSGNVDHIVDFAVGIDKIALDDAVFTGLGLGALNANAFTTGLQAQDADDRILYDMTTGLLMFDADGNGGGAAVLFATLLGAPAVSASDFIVI